MKHDLIGCMTTPMSNYLKAMGVLRLLTEQADREAAGFWEDSHFVILTTLDRAQLLDFFCTEYSPTPIVDPWNRGSGFYPKDNKLALKRIADSRDARFSQYREVISRISCWTGVSFTKEFIGDKKNKQLLLAKSRSSLPAPALDWLDVAYVLREKKQVFTPAFGTGGNEGRLEMSNNFMKQIVELFLKKDALPVRGLLESSLFNTLSDGLKESSIGQLNPGRAGGYNQGMGIEQKDFKINPWDFVLMMEGAAVLSGNAVRRYPTPDRSWSTLPFTVRYSDVGYSSASPGEKGFYETWLPTWRQPATWAEIRYLFGEGRSVIGRRAARNGLEFSRSVGMLGTDRGLSAFQRNIFLKRRGDSYVALPAGRINVRYEPRLEIINELDPLLSQVDYFLREFKPVPASYASLQRSVQGAIYEACRDATWENFIRLLRSLGRLENLLSSRDRSLDPALKRPLFGLSPRWLSVCDDGSAEVRIAGSISSIRSTGDVGTIRSVMSGTEPHVPNAWSRNGSRHWQGSNLPERLGGVLLRRLVEAEQHRETEFPLEALVQISAQDVMPFLYGETDDEKIEELLWAFTLIDWRKAGLKKIAGSWNTPRSEDTLSRSWCLLKLLHAPELARKAKVRMEPRVARLLSAGRISEALAASRKRLMVSGLKVFDVGYSDHGLDPARLLASLLIPVRDKGELEMMVMAKNGQEE